MNFRMIAKPITLFSVLILVGMGHMGYGQQKKEGSIQTDDIILEKERKIELKPEISRNFEPLDEIENLNKGRKMKYEFLERKWDAKNTAVPITSVIGPREGDELVSSFGQKYKNSG